MNDIRIKQYVDDIFRDVALTEAVREQKEELIVNITERVRDYMRDGLSFDTAFENAKQAIGDADELTASFTKIAQTPPPIPAEEKRIKLSASFKYGFTALSPFIYVLGGFLLGWWAWGWVIIPVSAILESPIPFRHKIPALSPFVYVLGGFLLGWWAFGWVIIPMAGILSEFRVSKA